MVCQLGLELNHIYVFPRVTVYIYVINIYDISNSWQINDISDSSDCSASNDTRKGNVRLYTFSES